MFQALNVEAVWGQSQTISEPSEPRVLLNRGQGDHLTGEKESGPYKKIEETAHKIGARATDIAEKSSIFREAIEVVV